MASSLSSLTKSLLNFRIKIPCHHRLFHTQGTPLNLHITSALCGAPMKKKKRVDPQMILMREQKKKKKIEKQIRRLEKYTQKLKPIEEIQISNKLRQESKLRQRAKTINTFEENEDRVKLIKEWCRYQQNLFSKDVKALATLEASQHKALAELRAESEELYQMSIQMDNELIPFKHKGPLYTIGIPDYEAPDGDYVDVSRKWD